MMKSDQASRTARASRTTRRDLLRAGLVLATPGTLTAAAVRATETASAPSADETVLMRPIPATGEMLPVVGLGSSASFQRLVGKGDRSAVGAVLRALVDHGGRIVDTAPSYGDSEAVSGDVAQALGLRDRIFWATKLNVAGWGGGKADVDRARQQLQSSLQRIGKRPVDLIQVHNLGDLDTQLPLLRQAKADGRIRYLGVTTTIPSQYEALERLMKHEPLDFIGIDYAIDNRVMEQTILPLAVDRRIGVLVYAPFGRTRLWEKVREQRLPDWAAEFDAQTWGQFLLKFVISHPAVTAATPATSRPEHMIDNMGAARGRLPDGPMRKRMIEYVQRL